MTDADRTSAIPGFRLNLQPLPEHLNGTDASALREHQIANDASMKSLTRTYWGEIIAYLKKSWTEFLTSDRC